MLSHPTTLEYLARDIQRERMREAEQARLVRLATAGRASSARRGLEIAAAVRHAISRVRRVFGRPQAHPAG